MASRHIATSHFNDLDHEGLATYMRDIGLSDQVAKAACDKIISLREDWTKAAESENVVV